LQKRMFNWPPHKCNGYIQGAVPGPPRLLTHPAVTHIIHWLVCEAVIVSKHLLPCHWCETKEVQSSEIECETEKVQSSEIECETEKVQSSEIECETNKVQ
jgi:hypothetical protein